MSKYLYVHPHGGPRDRETRLFETIREAEVYANSPLKTIIDLSVREYHYESGAVIKIIKQ